MLSRFSSYRPQALALAALIAVAACSSHSSSSPVSDSKPAIAGLTTYPGLSHQHTTDRQTYPQKPPVGGAHWPPQANGAIGWQRCGVAYPQPVIDEFAVHSLEHGAVWLTYQPDLPASEVAQLGQLLQVRPDYELLSPYPGQEGKVVATAWGVQVSVDTASDARLVQFIRGYAGGDQGEEPGADCVHGSDLNQATTAVGAS